MQAQRVVALKHLFNALFQILQSDKINGNKINNSTNIE